MAEVISRSVSSMTIMSSVQSGKTRHVFVELSSYQPCLDRDSCACIKVGSTFGRDDTEGDSLNDVEVVLCGIAREGVRFSFHGDGPYGGGVDVQVSPASASPLAEQWSGKFAHSQRTHSCNTTHVNSAMPIRRLFWKKLFNDASLFLLLW